MPIRFWHGCSLGLSSWMSSLLVAGTVSAGGVALRLTFIVAPAAVERPIADVAGVCVFGAMAVLLGFGIAFKMFGMS